MDVEIPDKLYFRIGEVADLTGIKPHVLRYWESEFGTFRPAKNRSRQRLYRRKDIELVLRIKDLLYNQGFTIAGAQKILRAKTAPQEMDERVTESVPVDRRLLEEIRDDLANLRRRLDTLPARKSDLP
ncbi:MAG: MerR family transcriptional regulator [Desulfuromonadales bacterium]|nr:MerR family transcriptional regulator [Desulfuromonadales bacterium]NIR33357.1 MerR family transcriptional regulator [Desulfuromonadales bacterium]NIS43352.1 MerR family transcriptional regulator [Desulfuromonadales bacterium]